MTDLQATGDADKYYRASLVKCRVPYHIHDGIILYVVRGVPPGGFLTAVISNDLREAFGRADIENREAMFDIVSWFYNHAPAPCWGSPERMTAWLTARQPQLSEKENS